MKNFRFFRAAAIGAASLVLAVSIQADSSWLTDFKKAQQQAKSGNKLLLVDFTGSDWCGWCIKLRKEVFSQPEFAAYATRNLVLMEVDFPKGKELPGVVKVQNEQLAQQYQVEGFPTILVLNGDGKKVGELSYEAGVPAGSHEARATPAAFIASLEKLRKG